MPQNGVVPVSERITPESLLGTVLDHPEARMIFQRALPGVANSPLILQLRNLPIRGMVDRNPALRSDPEAIERLWADLGAIEAEIPEHIEVPPVEPDLSYEPADTARREAQHPTRDHCGTRSRS